METYYLATWYTSIIDNTVLICQQRVYTDAYEGKSYVKAIKANCLDCCHGSKDDVSLCKVEICPLWSTRPFQNNEEPE